MKKQEKDSQVLSTLMLKRILIIAGVVLFSLAAYWILLPFALRIIYLPNIPEMPSLAGYSSVMAEYIEHVHSEALDKPYSEEAVGKLAMVYHSNFFFSKQHPETRRILWFCSWKR